MSTAFTHAFVAAAIGSLAPRGRLRVRLVLLGMLLAVLPDADVALFRLGVAYDHPLGHRGFSHSLPFAVLSGLAAAALGLRDLTLGSRAWWGAALMLCACGASHGVLDAFTDAGLGVGLLLPFDATRYFSPWRPLATSPLSVVAFFSGPALPILANEILWVWLPIGLVASAILAAGVSERLIILGGALCAALALPHAWLGWPAIAAQLHAAAVDPEVVAGISVGWHFGSLAMATLGLMVMAVAPRVGSDPRAFQAALLAGTCYVFFGLAASVYRSPKPQFVAFVLAGALVVGASLQARRGA